MSIIRSQPFHTCRNSACHVSTPCYLISLGSSRHTTSCQLGVLQLLALHPPLYFSQPDRRPCSCHADSVRPLLSPRSPASMPFLHLERVLRPILSIDHQLSRQPNTLTQPGIGASEGLRRLWQAAFLSHPSTSKPTFLAGAARFGADPKQRNLASRVVLTSQILDSADIFRDIRRFCSTQHT